MAIPVSEEFIAALTSRKRHMRVTGSLGKEPDDSDNYGINAIVDGEVTVDWTSYLEAPVRQASITISDPNRELFPDLSLGQAGNIWFSSRLRLHYGLQLPDGSWEDIPIFAGPVVEATRDGESLAITAVGKETFHQPPYALHRSFQVDAGTSYSQAIVDLLTFRGINEDRLDEIEIDGDDPVTHRNLHFGLGHSPWKILQGFAKHLDKQLLYRGRDVVLRSWTEDPEWTFVKGETSIVLDWPEQRMSMTDFFNTAFVVSDKIVTDGPQDAVRPEPIVGYAELPDSDPLSAETLSAGEGKGKPMLRIWERHASSFPRADQIAQQYITANQNGLDASISIRCLPLPHLDPMDIVELNFGVQGIDLQAFRLKNFNIPLTPDGEMTINWAGSRVPHRRWRQHHRGKHLTGRQ